MKSRFVDREETARAQVKCPHRLWIFQKEKTILHFGFLQDLFGLLELGDLLEQLLVGSRKTGGFFFYFGFPLRAQHFFAETGLFPLREKSVDVAHPYKQQHGTDGINKIQRQFRPQSAVGWSYRFE